MVHDPRKRPRADTALRIIAATGGLVTLTDLAGFDPLRSRPAEKHGETNNEAAGTDPPVERDRQKAQEATDLATRGGPPRMTEAT